MTAMQRRPNVDILLQAMIEIAAHVADINYTGKSYELILAEVKARTYQRLDEANPPRPTVPAIDYEAEYRALYDEVKKLQILIAAPTPPGFMGVDMNSILYAVNKLLEGRKK